jgi:hypothetical protein
MLVLVVMPYLVVRVAVVIIVVVSHTESESCGDWVAEVCWRRPSWQKGWQVSAQVLPH